MHENTSFSHVSQFFCWIKWLKEETNKSNIFQANKEKTLATIDSIGTEEFGNSTISFLWAPNSTNDDNNQDDTWDDDNDDSYSPTLWVFMALTAAPLALATLIFLLISPAMLALKICWCCSSSWSTLVLLLFLGGMSGCWEALLILAAQ
jgi:hypothetical protein